MFRRTSLLVTVLSASLSVLAFAPAALAATPQTPVADPGDYSVIAHRGYRGSGYTENSMKAFNAARLIEAPAVETDLHLTMDELPVLMHDSTLDRTTTCTGLVSAYTRADLLANCRTEDGQIIPTPERLLRWGNRYGMNVLLELKTDEVTRWTPDRYDYLSGAVARNQMQTRTRLLSYSAEMLQRAEAVDPGFFTTWIATSWTDPQQVVLNGDGVTVDAANLTTERVQELRDAGVQSVLGRNTSRITDWELLRAVGADGLLTNVTLKYLSWRAAQDGN